MLPNLADAQATLGSVCPEPILAAAFVNDTDESRRERRNRGATEVGKLGTNNWLVLTTAALRLYALGGRNGMKPRREVGFWPRAAVRVGVQEVVRSDDYGFTNGFARRRTLRLHIVGPDLNLALDAIVSPGLESGEEATLSDAAIAAEADPERREMLVELRREADSVTQMVVAIAAGCGTGPGTAPPGVAQP